MRRNHVLGGIAALAVVATLAGSAGARGGNHFCDEVTGTVHEDHFFPGGDLIAAGYVDLESAPRGVGGGADGEIVRTSNSESFGAEPITLTCGAPDGTWRLLESALGPGNDTLRMDARGLDDKNDYGPLPAQMTSFVTGGRGSDVIHGHQGFDDLSGGANFDILIGRGGRDRLRGGAGRDRLRARDDRKDNVSCGAGKDAATVDANDDLSGCERVTVR